MEILRDDEEQALKYKRTGRLDMSHGFLYHIRRNQIARDDYDKQVKQANERQRTRLTTTPRRPRRPDIQVYHPRRGNGSEPGGGAETEEGNESGSSTEPETHGTELFWLDYQADSGRVTSFIVHKVCLSSVYIVMMVLILLHAEQCALVTPVSCLLGGQAREGGGARSRGECSGLSHEGDTAGPGSKGNG
ncbi:UPF0561 protein C2orf68 homolog isoform X1 [Coregonus clupeaformis]|uniref:UPF0561 protein C2orf68 homolog isoform X1 n=1 Tax=Coregonus clupeaformis TaxID=59861 RepID=UPI001E1C88DE|nr:UPF0561 protein C2orf68 homolog isoform X1 [Coregonus clupeaformis]